MKKIETHYFHAYFEHIIQINNNNKNTEYSFQLY